MAFLYNCKNHKTPSLNVIHPFIFAFFADWENRFGLFAGYTALLRDF